MAQISIVDNFYNGFVFGLQPFTIPTILSVTSIASGLSSIYLIDEQQTTYWRSQDTSNQYIDIDLGVALSANSLVYLFGANFSTATVYGSTTNDFAATPYSQALNIYTNTRTNIRLGWWRMATNTYRYLRLLIPSQTPDNSATYFELAMIAVIPTSSVIAFSNYHQLPITPIIDRPGISNPYAAGGTSRTNTSRRSRQRFELTNLGFLIDDEESVLRIQRMNQDQKFLFIENLSTPTAESRTNDSSRVALVQRIGEFTYSLEGNVFETGFILEEQ